MRRNVIIHWKFKEAELAAVQPSLRVARKTASIAALWGLQDGALDIPIIANKNQVGNAPLEKNPLRHFL